MGRLERKAPRVLLSKVVPKSIALPFNPFPSRMALILRGVFGDVKGKGECLICCEKASSRGGPGCGICEEDHKIGHALPSEEKSLTFKKE